MLRYLLNTCVMYCGMQGAVVETWSPLSDSGDVLLLRSAACISSAHRQLRERSVGLGIAGKQRLYCVNSISHLPPSPCHLCLPLPLPLPLHLHLHSSSHLQKASANHFLHARQINQSLTDFPNLCTMLRQVSRARLWQGLSSMSRMDTGNTYHSVSII
jgi:hypothetical protein